MPSFLLFPLRAIKRGRVVQWTVAKQGGGSVDGANTSNSDISTHQGLSKQKEFGSTPMMKVNQIIVGSLDFFGAINKYFLKDRFYVIHLNYC